MTLALRRQTSPLICGFCQSGNHEHCPRGVRNGNGAILPCNCPQPYCGGQVVRCLECKNEEENEVSPDSWRCYDAEACRAEVAARLDRNPTIQLIREVEKRVSENTGTTTATKAEKAPKAPTYCLHCGEATRGGKFLPGHDARWVADLVKDVVDAKVKTEDQVLEQMGAAGASETLQGKLSKSVKLATEDREKRAAATKEAAEKKAAKEAEASEKLKEKAEKADAVAVPPAEDQAAQVPVPAQTATPKAKTATPKA